MTRRPSDLHAFNIGAVRAASARSIEPPRRRLVAQPRRRLCTRGLLGFSYVIASTIALGFVASGASVWVGAVVAWLGGAVLFACAAVVPVFGPDGFGGTEVETDYGSDDEAERSRLEQGGRR